MSTIQIQNVGPLTYIQRFRLTPILLFLGKQSAGKSTLMKIISFCCWIEKQVMTGGDDVVYQYTHYSRFIKELMQFHRFDEKYFSSNTLIDYEGDCVHIRLEGNKKNARIEKKSGFESNRYNTKLSFIPSERNLVSVFDNIDRTYRSNGMDVLFNYIYEWSEAHVAYTTEHPKRISVTDNMVYYYDSSKGMDVIRLLDKNVDFKTKYASSGVQSALPIEVMVDYFVSQLNRPIGMSKQQLDRLLKHIFDGDGTGEIQSHPENKLHRLASYQNVRFFVEEPEQNLYPESQKELVMNMIAAVKKAKAISDRESYLTMTTHSPYIVSVLNVLLKAAKAYEINAERAVSFVPMEVIFAVEDISAYYICDGRLENILEEDLPMVSGNQLDSVSDWVENSIAALNDIIYG